MKKEDVVKGKRYVLDTNPDWIIEANGRFTFIHNKIKFDSLQALQDTLDHLHELNNEL